VFLQPQTCIMQVLVERLGVEMMQSSLLHEESHGIAGVCVMDQPAHGVLIHKVG